MLTCLKEPLEAFELPSLSYLNKCAISLIVSTLEVVPDCRWSSGFNISFYIFETIAPFVLSIMSSCFLASCLKLNELYLLSDLISSCSLPSFCLLYAVKAITRSTLSLNSLPINFLLGLLHIFFSGSKFKAVYFRRL